jgi:hypothetical protein
MGRSPEIETAYRRFCELRSATDNAIFEESLSSHGVLFVGPDPEEWFNDDQKLRKVLGSQGLTISPVDPVGYTDGEMGWVADRSIFTHNGSTVTMRMTLVMHKENDRWKIVHLHASSGVPIDQIFH